MKNQEKVSISVRNLVEFIMRSGDIDNRGGSHDPDAMQEGSRLHRKIQKSMDASYRPEVTLKHEIPVQCDDEEFVLEIEGRADGIFCGTPVNPESEEETITVIDEIKTTYMDTGHMEKPAGVHRAQAMCYAYIYACKNGLKQIGIQMTYCQLETELINRFREDFDFEFLESWFGELKDEYIKWAVWQRKWIRTRDASIRSVEFPFEYRDGQRELVAGVYRTISRGKNLYIEAPTGVGKTISTVFPAVRAMGEQKAEKLFYGTAKTITRTVAEEAFGHLISKGMKLKLVTITAKEKICVLDKPDCNPTACARAAGHYDRVNDAVFDMLVNEDEINRELIIRYAEKHSVCPFEMCLDVTLWADAIICDYNYLFDPNVYLRRFFANESKRDYVFLIDEAHNLVDRAREMYSAVLIKEDFMKVKRMVGTTGYDHERLSKVLEQCNRALLAMKRECDEFEVWEDVNSLEYALLRFAAVYEELPSSFSVSDREMLSMLYLDVRHFLRMCERLDENYMIYSDYDDERQFRLKLQCMDPSQCLKECIKKGRSAVFFSATLLPIKYYKDQLAGEEDDYAVYAPSPFDTEKRLLMVAQDVSTKYTRRNASEYEKIVRYIEVFTGARRGNYMVFFPSYQMMNEIAQLCDGRLEGLVLQSAGMTEDEKEEFLEAFNEEGKSTRIGFCVMGGIFGEGIDLKNDRLIGAVIVGTGLPMVCNERELFRGFYDARNNTGFEYAYLYSGMNKVLQSAGRVIRTTEDVGAVLLLDERFGTEQYQELFPREWYPYTKVRLGNVEGALNEFWAKLR